MPAAQSRRNAQSRPSPVEVDLSDIDVHAPSLNLRSTKQELLDAYESLRSKVKRQREQADAPPRQEAEQRRQSEVVARARSFTVEEIVAGTGRLKVQVGSTLDELNRKLVAEVEKLTTVEAAIQVQSDKLKTLHDIEVAADSLTLLLQRHTEAEADLEARVRDKRAAVEAELQAARQKVEAELSAAQEAWATEQSQQRSALDAWCAARKGEAEEEAQIRARERQREQEEYDYNTAQQRRRAEDSFQAKASAQAEALAQDKARFAERVAEQERVWQEREAELSALKADVEAFSARLESAVHEARAQEKAAQAREHDIQHQLLERDLRRERELAALRIESLTHKLSERDQRIEQLEREVQAGAVKVQQIAVQAIESASGRRALDAVNEIALEQAKGGKPAGT